MLWTRRLAVFLSALFLGGCFGGKPEEQQDGSSVQVQVPVSVPGVPSRASVAARSGAFHESPEQKFCSLQSPVRLGLELAAPANATDPLELTARVTTTVPISEAEISLIFPAMGEKPSVKTTLWSGEIESRTFREVVQRLPPLPEGKHIVTVALRLKTDVRGLTSGFSRSLYIDVGRHGAAWSDISFNHLAMLELKKRIEELGFGGLSFAQLKTTAPALAAEVEALHVVGGVAARPERRLHIDPRKQKEFSESQKRAGRKK